MKVLSLFSGIGAFEKALDRLNIDYELVAFSEIDKYATKSYCAIHGVDESMNLGDITKVDENSLPKDIDLITYGFPCQDISLAGKQKGLFNNDGTQTRSGLFFEALRIIEATKPKIAIAENVKNLTGKKFKEQFELVLKSLEEAGYSNYWKVLNAKDYGIPQNRERVFIISIRKDIDTNKFEFPKDFIPRNYYDNVVGVYVNEDLPVVNLKIRVYGVQMEYMRMLPLHKSQSEVKSRYGEFAEFTYRVCLTPELKSKILAMGPNVEVLEPLEYREEIMSQISASLDRYMKKE